MNYILPPGNKQYSFSYQKLKAQYKLYLNLTDEEFLNELPDILHFACFVSWVKELGPQDTISDTGIVHELIHLLTDKETTKDISDVRKYFKDVLKLS